MKNLWVQNSFPMATWTANVAPLADSSRAVKELLLEIIALGISHEVAIVDFVQVQEAIALEWATKSVISCNILFDMAPLCRLSWYAPDGRLMDDCVHDPGALLRSLEPTPGAIYHKNMDNWSALEVSGSRLNYSSGNLSRTIDEQIFSFTTYSDIWFPFVTGAAHPSWDGDRYFDNRELANRHTPRLNAYLEAVASAVTAAGGRWEIEHACVARLVAPWVTERGILLDGPVPPLMPPELVDVPWPSLDE